MDELVQCFLENNDKTKTSVLSLDIQNPSANPEFPFLFRRGEVTVWAGESGVGLSTLLGQIALSLANQNQKVCITSGETTRYSLFLRLIQQSTGVCTDQLTETEVNDFYKKYSDLIELDEFHGARAFALDNMILVYDRISTPCREERGANHYFVDSLETHIGLASKNDLQDFMFNLNSIAKEHEIHIHVACHLHPRVDKSDSDTVFVRQCMRELEPLCEIASNVFLLTDREPLSNLGFSPSLRKLMLCKQRNGTCNLKSLLKMDYKTLTFCTARSSRIS